MRRYHPRSLPSASGFFLTISPTAVSSAGLRLGFRGRESLIFKKTLAVSGERWHFPGPQSRERTMAYAIIKTGGKQYRVAAGDKIDVEKLDVAVGDTVTFDEVLASGSGDSISVGAPFLDGATVTAKVVDQFRDKKVIAFKFKRRKGFHKTKGHRRHLTRLEIVTV
jgi:large subunit ribosomal protein L21